MPKHKIKCSFKPLKAARYLPCSFNFLEALALRQQQRLVIGRASDNCTVALLHDARRMIQADLSYKKGNWKMKRVMGCLQLDGRLYVFVCLYCKSKANEAER